MGSPGFPHKGSLPLSTLNAYGDGLARIIRSRSERIEERSDEAQGLKTDASRER